MLTPSFNLPKQGDTSESAFFLRWTCLYIIIGGINKFLFSFLCHPSIAWRLIYLVVGYLICLNATDESENEAWGGLCGM